VNIVTLAEKNLADRPVNGMLPLCIWSERLISDHGCGTCRSNPKTLRCSIAERFREDFEIIEVVSNCRKAPAEATQLVLLPSTPCGTIRGIKFLYGKSRLPSAPIQFRAQIARFSNYPCPLKCRRDVLLPVMMESA
jgi:hypothetical protein